MASITTAPAAPALSRRWKYALWTVMAAATLSVAFHSEIPLLHQAAERRHLHELRWMLIPHAIAGTIAFLTGPFQFSTRLRRRHPRFHRVLGRLYVGAVFLAAPLAILSTAFHNYPRAIYFQIAIATQGGAWFVTTAVALVAAIRRRIPQHRMWMTRSYAVTFTFIGTRVLQPVPGWNHLGRFWFAVAIICITALACVTPQIARGLRSLANRSSVEPGTLTRMP